MTAPARWQADRAWCVLHTAFGQGAHFVRTWAAWRRDPQRPPLLHYVALAAQAPAWPDPDPAPAGGADSDAEGNSELQSLARTLQAQCQGLGCGQHRLAFDAGRVLLTLCVGPALALLRQQQFDADRVVLALADPPAAPWDEWSTKALAQRCRRGTRLVCPAAPAELRQWLRQCGFVLDGAATPATEGAPALCATFDPAWTLRNTREPWRRARTPPGRCAVIGAGMAGASVASALARRGWQVEVFDQAPHPAAGASALPVGLAAPLVSVDDNVLSRLVRSGVRLSLQQAQQWLVAGRDWAPSGVQEQRFDDQAPAPVPPLWHAQAGWIKPAALVQAWLAQPGIGFHGHVAVHNLRRDAGGWTLLDPLGQPIATVARVVLANATGAVPLLERVQAQHPDWPLHLHQLPATHAVRGLVSWARHDSPELRPFPPVPVNGNGSLIAGVPFADGARWFVGASYQPASQPEWPDEKNHGANVLRLEKLLPVLSAALAPVFEAGALHAWKGVRCVTADRLPLVGSLLDDDPGLWLCAGLGSRGLSLTVLCAELLAAQWAGEPLPVEASLAQALNARRKGRQPS